MTFTRTLERAALCFVFVASLVLVVVQVVGAYQRGRTHVGVRP